MKLSTYFLCFKQLQMELIQFMKNVPPPHLVDKTSPHQQTNQPNWNFFLTEKKLTWLFSTQWNCVFVATTALLLSAVEQVSG